MKKTILLAVSLFLASAGAAPFLAAQTNAATDASVSITAQHIPQQVPFAAPFDVRFEMAHTPGYVLELDKENLPEGFELTNEKMETLSPGTAAFELTFMPFTLGVSTFTAVTFQIKERAGAETLGTAASEEQNITVNPVKYFDEPTLRDIRPPYIPSGILFWILCLLTLGLIVYFLRRFYRDLRAKKLELAQTHDNRPADVIALCQIETLLQSGLWERAEYKIFYIELGNILREYFWRRFHLDVSSDTSAELLRRARKTPALREVLPPLRDYLTSSDLVKFAKVIPTQETAQKDVQTVRNIVKNTTVQVTSLKEER